MLDSLIGVVLDGRERALVRGDVVEVTPEELPQMRAFMPCTLPLTDLDAPLEWCKRCRGLWRRPHGLPRTIEICPRCSSSTEHRVRLLS